jgi:hypothetical protein
METISDNYLAEQQKLHENPDYGVASIVFAPIVAKLMRDNGWKSIHDYGAGKQNLRRALEVERLEFRYSAYDPVFPEYGEPNPADLVCCIDVLEHIEPDRLDAVLDDLMRIVTRFGFFSIHTGPATKVLSDGRNAHLIQALPYWWLPHLCKRFEILHLQAHRLMGPGFWVVVSPLPDHTPPANAG